MKKLSQFITESKRKYNIFIILKPEFLQYEEELDGLLKYNGWKVIDKKHRTLTSGDTESLYNMHKEEPWFQNLVKYMSSGESVGYTCYKDIQNPVKDMEALKDKVRKEWGKDDMKNAMHSSDSDDNVKREAKIYFNE